MSLLKSIKKDNEIESYFLEFLKWNINLDEIIEKLDKSNSPELKKELVEIEKKLDISITILLKELSDRYDFRIRQMNESDSNYILFLELYDFYFIKHGEEKIKRFDLFKESKQTLKFAMESSLYVDSNKCITCKCLRTELDFEQLPEVTKKIFADRLSEADYFLYCSSCKTYSMSYKMESFGFDE